MNIYLFDFDNTIVELPYEETIEYLDNDGSLNPKLNFKPIKKTKEDYKDSIPILGSEPEVKHPISSMLDKSYRVFENMFKW